MGKVLPLVSRLTKRLTRSGTTRRYLIVFAITVLLVAIGLIAGRHYLLVPVSPGNGTNSDNSNPDEVPPVLEATYYVDVNNGDDDNTGMTIDAPFKTIHKAASVVQSGNLIYIRGGDYDLGSQLTFDKSGTLDNPITFEAYPGETVTIDGSNASLSGWQPPLITVEANWNAFRNLTIRDSPGRGIYVAGNENVFEHIVTHHHRGSGIHVYESSGTKLLYVTAYDNYDDGGIDPGQHADGITISSGNNSMLVGCVSHDNSDDGFDTWESTNNTIEACVSYNNGYDHGNGNGFKLGPGGFNTVKRCVAYNNTSNGFEYNNGNGNTIEYCTAYNNDQYDFSDQGNINTYKYNISHYGDVVMSSAAIQSRNTWNLSIGDPQFLSTDPSSPDFLSLSSNSPCRGAGDDSDLGALQYDEKIADLAPSFYT